MTRVKICGLTTGEDRDVAVRAGADAVGFIVDVPVDTPREISVERASDLIASTPPFVTTVLVTMPDAVQDAVALQDRVGADAIQVHAGLSPSYLAGLRERVGAKVLGVVAATDPELPEFANAADAVLVDSVDAQGGGGTGETQDWERTRERVAGLETPVILAGGLRPGNVADAIDEVRPYAVDVATGVEDAGGSKDHQAVRSFVANATAEGSR